MRRHAIHGFAYLDLIGRGGRGFAFDFDHLQNEGIQAGSCYRRSTWLMGCLLLCHNGWPCLAGVSGGGGLCCWL